MSLSLITNKQKNNIIGDIEFNNELQRGINAGLWLYWPEIDLTLFKQVDTKKLDKVNFDEINKKLDDAGWISKNIEKVGASVGSFLNDLTKGVGEWIKNVGEGVGGAIGGGAENILSGVGDGLLKNPLFILLIALGVIVIIKK